MDTTNSINANNVFKQALKKLRNKAEYNDSLNTLINEKKAILGAFFNVDNDHYQNQFNVFLHRYIDHAMEYILAYQYLSEITVIERYTQPYLSAASDYFHKSHSILDQWLGLHNHLSRAYSCHRLLEELNDRIRIERKWPLAPTDTTYSNLIVHTLLGEDNANLLDQDVFIRIELIEEEHNETKAVFGDKRSQQLLVHLCQKGWNTALEEWIY